MNILENILISKIIIHIIYKFSNNNLHIFTKQTNLYS